MQMKREDKDNWVRGIGDAEDQKAFKESGGVILIATILGIVLAFFFAFPYAFCGPHSC